MSVVAIGYLAGMMRMVVEHLPVPPNEGVTGELSIPSITADAPLVALGLAAQGITCRGIFNDPGRSRLGVAVRQFVEDCLPSLIIGPYFGELYEFQVISRASGIMWFADTSYGVKSLASLDTRGVCDGVDIIYVDAYPWLEEPISQFIASNWKGTLIVNIGHREISSLPSLVYKWRSLHPKGSLIIQLSTGSSPLSDNNVIEVANSACLIGADCIIITRGEKGICVTMNDETSLQPALQLATVGDPTGAGAAVSVALCSLLSRSRGTLSPNASEIAELLNSAGAKQCEHKGPLDRRNQKNWNEVVSKMTSCQQAGE